MADNSVIKTEEASVQKKREPIHADAIDELPDVLAEKGHLLQDLLRKSRTHSTDKKVHTASRQLSIRYAWHNRPLLNFCHALDKLGYTKDLAEKKVLIADNAAECLTTVTNSVFGESTYVIIAGSRGEGASVSWNSDLDLMFVQPAIQCFATCSSADIVPDVAAFQLEFDDVPKGYAKLHLMSNLTTITKSEKYNALIGKIRDSLTEENFLKNDRNFIAAIVDNENKLTKGWVDENHRIKERTGPSRPLDIQLPIIDKHASVDYVAAFPCSYPPVLDEWCTRQRTGIWPSEPVLNAAKETDVFVVPVGLAGHEEESLHWRLSFTLAERYLIRSFNDTQIKLYVAMKMLEKQVFKPICAKITSYVVKNMIFWVFEKRSGTFTRNDFGEILTDVLKYMKDCVKSGCFPNYIIPSRNLLREEISDAVKADLILCLDTLIGEGQSVLHRCPLIYSMSDLSEDDLKVRLIFRELSHQLLLACFSVAPSIYDRELVPLLFKAQTSEELINTLEKHVLPLIRKSNPFNFFNHLIEKNAAEITFLMFEGVQQGYDKIWMDSYMH